MTSPSSNRFRVTYITEPAVLSVTTAKPTMPDRPGSPSKCGAITKDCILLSVATTSTTVSATTTCPRTSFDSGTTPPATTGAASPRVSQFKDFETSDRRFAIVLNSKNSNIRAAPARSGCGASSFRFTSSGTSRRRIIMAAFRFTRSPCSTRPAFSFGVWVSAAASTPSMSPY